MYLELHKGSKTSEMEEINRQILKAFEYLAVTVRFDKRTFEKALGNDGQWLWECFAGEKKFEMTIRQLARLPQADRVKIYKALEHDMEFEKSISDPLFEFSEKKILPEHIDMVKDVFKFLYDIAFRKGQVTAFGAEIEYADLLEGLFTNNPVNLCPACLGTDENLKKSGEVDHYLPRVKYPALTFHPYNLTAICEVCNGTRKKGMKNPLRTGKLTESYLPYLRAAESETLLEVTGVGGKYHVKLVPKDPLLSVVQTRIDNLDYLFHLQERWTDRMDRYVEEQMDYLEELDTASKVEDKLKELEREEKTKAGKRKDCLLSAAYCDFLSGRGKQSILDDWNRRQLEKEKMKK